MNPLYKRTTQWELDGFTFRIGADGFSVVYRTDQREECAPPLSLDDAATLMMQVVNEINLLRSGDAKTAKATGGAA